MNKVIPPDPAPRRDADRDRFTEERHALLWLLAHVRAGKPLPVTEAEAVVHALYIGLQRAGRDNLPHLATKDAMDYGAVHALDVAMLAMAVAEHAGFAPDDVRAVGVAGLLTDIGMARLPAGLLTKEDRLTDDERALVKQHPVTGASILLEADGRLALAATVAYEHHLKLDGSGYPEVAYERQPHPVSRLVQLCDNYHALRTSRPYRQAWPRDIALDFLQQRAGFEFDATYAPVLAQVVSAQKEGY